MIWYILIGIVGLIVGFILGLGIGLSAENEDQDFRDNN